MSAASAVEVLSLLEGWASAVWTVPPQDFFAAQVDLEVLQESVVDAEPLGAEPGLTGHLALRETGWSGWWAADLYGIREVGCFPGTPDPARLADQVRELLRFRATPLPHDPFGRWQLHDHLIEVRVYGAERGRPVLAVSAERPGSDTPFAITT